jgi:hypothetical protein
MKGRELPMLMDIKCSMVPSIKVDLAFDDGHKKSQTLSVGDLIDLLYNSNGLRKHIIGIIRQINTPGCDPKGWSIIVDGSDDFESEIARLSPMSILDVDIIRKAGSSRTVSSPNDDTGIYAIRIKEGRLQYTRDGKHWRNIKIDDIDIIPGKDVIIDEDGRPERPTGEGHHGPNIIIDENN